MRCSKYKAENREEKSSARSAGIRGPCNVDPAGRRMVVRTSSGAFVGAKTLIRTDTQPPHVKPSLLQGTLPRRHSVSGLGSY